LEKLAEQYDCRLLVDETYRDLTAGEPYPSAAGISPRVIAVSSVSKAYGAPGLRVGWLVTKDPELYELFLAAKEQIGICGSIVDENLALAVLEQRDVWLRAVRAERAERLEIIQEWVVRDELIDWVRPEGGVVCFPWMNVPATFDFDQFYSRLLAEHGTYVGPGHWFEMPRNFMRIGFSWPTVDELKAGLAGISLALRQTL
jgi:aspartate/methionine/tyrosine aminotransferase